VGADAEALSVVRAEWQRVLVRRGQRLEGALRDAWLRRFGARPALAGIERLIFVCHGNVCRSVFAEYYLRSRVPGIDVRSAGVDVQVSMPPPQTAIETAHEFDLELADHRSKPLEPLPDSPATAYLTLEPWHGRVRALAAPRAAGRVHLFGLWSDPPRSRFADPYGGDRERFRRCFRDLQGALDRLAADLERRGTGGR
jgi:protein-tyrosine phosphatase